MSRSLLGLVSRSSEYKPVVSKICTGYDPVEPISRIQLECNLVERNLVEPIQLGSTRCPLAFRGALSEEFSDWRVFVGTSNLEGLQHWYCTSHSSQVRPDR